MADYNSSLPVRTQNDGDVVSKIADATTPSQQLKVNADGSINVTDNGGSLTVDASDLDIRDLSHSQDSVKVGDGTDFVAVNTDGSLNITDNGGSLTVDASDLDIRDLSANQDSVESWIVDEAGNAFSVANPLPTQLSDGTDTVAINADGSLNITDNGGSLTVDASDLDIRDLSHAQDSVKVGDGTDFVAVNNDGSLNITDNGGSLTVDASDLDIRDLSATQDSVEAWIVDEAGNPFSSSNPLPVTFSEDTEGVEINNYLVSAAVAAGASANHDYTVTALKTLLLKQIWAAASGKMKIEVQIETGPSTNVFNTVFVGFNSTANPNIEIPVKSVISVAAGVRVRIIRTNKDNQAQDLYSTISGNEV